MLKKVIHLLTDGFGGSEKQRKIVKQVAEQEKMDYASLEGLLLANKYETGRFFDYSPKDILFLAREGKHHYYNFYDDSGEIDDTDFNNDIYDTYYADDIDDIDYTNDADDTDYTDEFGY